MRRTLGTLVAALAIGLAGCHDARHSNPGGSGAPTDTYSPPTPDAGQNRDVTIPVSPPLDEEDAGNPDIPEIPEPEPEPEPLCEFGETLEETCCGPGYLGLQATVCGYENGEPAWTETDCRLDIEEFNISRDPEARDHSPRVNGDFVVFLSNRRGNDHTYIVDITELGRDPEPICVSCDAPAPTSLNWGNDWRNDGCTSATVYGWEVLFSCNWREVDVFSDDFFPGIVYKFDLFEGRYTNFVFNLGGGETRQAGFLRGFKPALSETTIALQSKRERNIHETRMSRLKVSFVQEDNTLEERAEGLPFGYNTRIAGEWVAYESLRDMFDEEMDLPDVYVTRNPGVGERGVCDNSNVSRTWGIAETNPVVNEQGTSVYETEDEQLYWSTVVMRDEAEECQREAPAEALTEGQNPAVYNDLLAFTRMARTGQALHLRDLSTEQEAKLTKGRQLLGRIDIDRTRIVYTRGNEEESEVYLLRINPAEQCRR